MTELAIDGNGDRRCIVIDDERVSQVIGRLIYAYEQNEFPYNLDSTRTPQDHRHMPQTLEYGTKEHAMFLWTVCYYMRGGIKSNDAVMRLAKMYDMHPELFVAESAMICQKADLRNLLSEYGLGLQETVSNAWVENAARLYERYDGDPRKIFDGVTTYQQSLSRIKNDGKGGGFIGFREKMVSMIIYYLSDEGLIKEFEFPLPVDIHVLRVSIANELVKFEGYAEDENLLDEDLLITVRGLYLAYARQHNVSMLTISDAVWLLSQSTCGMHPGNVTLEPHGRGNRKGRQTHLIPAPVNADDESQRELYARTCALCPIEETCRWNVPGKIYYVQGKLIRRGERLRYPPPSQGLLF
ncbi:MAG: hypothetical protein MUF85_00330 [Patescibacteria group bacterium]|nr:hypothetical protein [Patescibacteria group bacterium]